MIIALVSLIILLLSASMAARRLVRLLDLTTAGEHLPWWIAWGTLTVAWCLFWAQALACVSELLQVALVRMPIIAALSAAGAIALASLSSPVTVVGSPMPGRTGRRIRFLWACVLPIVALHAFLVIEALLRPPSGCDGLFYHLPMVVRWLETGRLAMVPEVRFFNYPANCELWQMFFASPRVEPLIELSLMPVGLLLALIVAGLSRELGARPDSARLAALCALACPMIALQMYSTFVDMFGTTFILGGLYWLIRFDRAADPPRQRHGLVLLMGVSIGLAVGTKFTFGPYAILIALGAVAAMLRAAGRTRRALQTIPSAVRRRAVGPSASHQVGRGILVLAMASLVTGGFWYSRNLYRTGWPFYPIQLQVAGRTVGTGWSLDRVSPVKDVDDRGLACLAYPWFEWKRSGYPYAPDNGLGPALAAFGIPGLAYLALRRRRWRRPGDYWGLGWTWAFVVLGLTCYLTIFRPAARYILPTWAVMLAASALMFDLVLRTRPRLTVALVTLVLGLSTVMTALEPARVLAGRLRDGDLSRAHAYQIPELFDTLPAGTVILNLGSGGMNYPLLGAGWRNRVIEPFTAWHRGYRRPYDRSKLDALGVNLVYTQGDLPDVFADDVTYEVIYDDSADAARPPTTAVTRVYRVTRPSDSSERPS